MDKLITCALFGASAFAMVPAAVAQPPLAPADEFTAIDADLDWRITPEELGRYGHA